MIVFSASNNKLTQPNTELEALRGIITQTLKNNPKSSNQTQPRQKLDEKTAAKTILETWRASKINASFTKDSYKTYLSLLEANENKEHKQSNELAKIMFGQTIAADCFKENIVRNPFKDFHSSTGTNYRRDSMSENSRSVEQLGEQFNKEIEFGYPISSFHQFSIDELMKIYLHSYKDSINIISKKDEPTVFLEPKCDLVLMKTPFDENKLSDLPIKSSMAYIRTQRKLFYVDKTESKCTELKITENNLNKFDRDLKPSENPRSLSGKDMHTLEWITGHNIRKNFGKIYGKIKATGVNASLWQFYRSYHRWCSLPKIDGNDTRGLGLYGEVKVDSKTTKRMSTYLSDAPQSIRGLKNHPIMASLAKTALFENHPTKFLALCLRKMINGLPNDDTPNPIIQRIYVFLSIALKFHKKNYEKFAFGVYGIVHEISLLLLALHEQGQYKINYSQFKQETIRNGISSFGLDKKAGDQYRYIAAPANCGNHAYTIAMKLAQQIRSTTRPPTLQVLETYFEYEKLHQNQRNEDADIYLISAGPMVQLDGLHPGIDINEVIRNRILKGRVRPAKPVVIVIDATTALYKNLKIDDTLQQHIRDGYISLIVFESHQKFGLLHTDQAQDGRVFGMVSFLDFNPEDIDSFESNAEKDLSTHLDMRIGAFINIHCGPYLEYIKQRHFNVGSIYRHSLADLKLSNTSAIPHPQQLKNEDELCFIVDSQENTTFHSWYNRDSFGHYATTIGRVGEHCRVSPHASDVIDASIDVAMMAQRKNRYDARYLINLMETYFSNPSDLVNEIILLGALRSQPKFWPNNFKLEAETIEMIGRVLEMASATMRGRQAHADLRRVYANSIRNYYLGTEQNYSLIWEPDLDVIQKFKHRNDATVRSLNPRRPQ